MASGFKPRFVAQQQGNNAAARNQRSPRRCCLAGIRTAGNRLFGMRTNPPVFSLSGLSCAVWQQG